jgi:hypothetical protein
METAIVVVVAVLTAGWYFGSDVQWWLWKVLLFGMIRAECLISSLRRVLYVVCNILGYSPAYGV